MKRTGLSLVLVSLLLGGVLVAKEDVTQQTKNIVQINQTAVSNAKKDAKAHQQKYVQEAIDSLKYAHQALVDLEKKDTKQATEDIAKALGKLEVILAAEKAPKLLPIDGTLVAKEYIGSKEDVEKALKEVKELLEDGKVQEARVLLNTLQSEIDVTIVNLPLSSYPDALKLAAKYIHDNKVDKAKEILAVALNTFDSITEVIPLPLVKTVELTRIASTIAKEDKEKALKLLDGAEEELDVAQILGYVSESDTTYKELHKMVQEIKKEIKGKNEVEKLFETFLSKLKEFKTKAQTSTHETK